MNVEARLKRVQQLLPEEENLSASFLRATLEVVIMLVQLMANRLSLTSRNSSKLPSTGRFKVHDKASSDEVSSKPDPKK
ncbi:hypothetical protein [Methylocucumis oryzae]|uniref:Uncharacterized protein n=1 Tax=Methylocucumis oryzae TaxID=1632867 RepID=A0A0F3ILY6_9GAMM|nr:hypothetical protein [Methylocucumis oryzae]KJV07751.1 hypothetical protein VZ94_02645 [Methylocucumis oryzae]